VMFGKRTCDAGDGHDVSSVQERQFFRV